MAQQASSASAAASASGASRSVIEAATAAGKQILVDPKGTDYARYRGATMITPNRNELAQVVGGWTSEEIITGKKSTPPPPRKTARWIEHDGQRKTLTEWAREIGIPMKALHQQLSRGWSISDAIGAARKKGELDEQKHAA